MYIYLCSSEPRPFHDPSDPLDHIRTETGIYTVGYYTPQGEWCPESDHNGPERAAERAAWLNGGGSSVENKLEEIRCGLIDIEEELKLIRKNLGGGR